MIQAMIKKLNKFEFNINHITKKEYTLFIFIDFGAS
jgi:hypothetical protein